MRAQFDRVLDSIASKFPDAAEHLDDARADLLAFTGFARELWRQIWSNNPQERLNKEIAAARRPHVGERGGAGRTPLRWGGSEGA